MLREVQKHYLVDIFGKDKRLRNIIRKRSTYITFNNIEFEKEKGFRLYNGE